MKIEGRPTPSFRRRACPVPRYGAGIQRGEGRRPATFIPLMWPSQGHGHSGEEPAPYPDTGPESRGARGGGPPLSFLLCGLRKAMVIPAKSLPRTPIRGRNPEGRGEEARHFHSLMWPDKAMVIPAKSLPRTPIRGRNPEGRGEEARHFHSLMWPDKAMVIPAKSLPRTPIRGRNPEGRGEEARHFHSSYVAFARPWSFRRRACPVPRYGAGIQRGEGRRPAIFIPLMWPSQGHGHSGEEPAPYPDTGPESRGGGASIIVNTIWE